ncbi:MAG: phosphoribosylformylglycinamidine synthase subunit PurQ [Desulfovibrionaceae bacterium]|nr:phosphoribosylformylglycinamidine synthase subunit PurQ [Desulfovibrionaceae bacterium]
MSTVNALILTGYGTNSHKETAHAARLGGADRADIIHFADLAAGSVRLLDYRFLVFPGGFLDGDDLGAGLAGAKRWLYLEDANGVPLLESLKSFLREGGLILGICNGFQLLVKLGILPALTSTRQNPVFKQDATLSHNDSARFEDRWVSLLPNPASPCVFTKGLNELLAMPVRHGEGKLIAQDEATLKAIAERNLIALQYADPATGKPTQEYPLNPNGSPLGIAGLTDPTGRVLGLMPHPEAFNHPTNHPNWTRGEKPTLGVALFKNAVDTLRSE